MDGVHHRLQRGLVQWQEVVRTWCRPHQWDDPSQDPWTERPGLWRPWERLDIEVKNDWPTECFCFWLVPRKSETGIPEFKVQSEWLVRYISKLLFLLPEKSVNLFTLLPGASFDPMGQGAKGPAPPLEQKSDDRWVPGMIVVKNLAESFHSTSPLWRATSIYKQCILQPWRENKSFGEESEWAYWRKLLCEQSWWIAAGECFLWWSSVFRKKNQNVSTHCFKILEWKTKFLPILISGQFNTVIARNPKIWWLTPVRFLVELRGNQNESSGVHENPALGTNKNRVIISIRLNVRL